MLEKTLAGAISEDIQTQEGDAVMKSYGAVLLVLALLILVPACSSLPEKPAAASIAPRGVLERCVTVSQGQRLNYCFDTVEQVMFTVTPSRGGQAADPLVRERTNSARGGLEPEVETTYCFRWNNPTGRNVRVSHSLTVVEQ